MFCMSHRNALFEPPQCISPRPEYLLKQGVVSSCNGVKKVAEAGDLCYPLFNKPNSWEHHNHYGVTYIPPLSLREEEKLIWLFSYEYCSFYVNWTDWESILSFEIFLPSKDFTSCIDSYKKQTLSQCRVAFHHST